MDTQFFDCDRLNSGVKKGDFKGRTTEIHVNDEMYAAGSFIFMGSLT